MDPLTVMGLLERVVRRYPLSAIYITTMALLVVVIGVHPW